MRIIVAIIGILVLIRACEGGGPINGWFSWQTGYAIFILGFITIFVLRPILNVMFGPWPFKFRNDD